MFDPAKRKKRRRGAPSRATDTPNTLGVPTTGLVDDGGLDYSYEMLLERVYEFIQSRNPALANRETKRLKPPKVERVGSTRSCWVNFDEICSSLQRNPDHVKDFYLTELNTTGSVDGKKQMIIKGKYPAKQIESLLRKYISEYVMCENCRSLETTLSRDAETRLFFISCHACGASRSVSAIRGGFKAVRKGERRRARIK